MRHNRNTVIFISSACVVLGVACSSDDSSDGVTGREQPLEETGGASGAAGALPDRLGLDPDRAVADELLGAMLEQVDGQRSLLEIHELLGGADAVGAAELLELVFCLSVERDLLDLQE